jgi:hypothetical protein
MTEKYKCKHYFVMTHWIRNISNQVNHTMCTECYKKFFDVHLNHLDGPDSMWCHICERYAFFAREGVIITESKTKFYEYFHLECFKEMCTTSFIEEFK